MTARSRPPKSLTAPKTPRPEHGRLSDIRRALAAGWTAPVARLVGFSITRISPGRCRVELEAGSQHANPMGTLHGGVLCDIADAAMGMAYASRLRSDESFTTIELKINFLRPFWQGRLIGDGSLLRKGRSSGLVACRIKDDKSRLVAYATSTCLTLPAGPGGSLERPGGRPKGRRKGGASPSTPG
ncbi:MAG: PaaI family thioesterase [Thermoplasmata archaeon]|nr:PaaI family thioesterase [Thermoplasmata archaeon]